MTLLEETTYALAREQNASDSVGRLRALIAACDEEAKTRPDARRIVHARVDAWVFAFRVELEGDLIATLEQAAIVRAEHGACPIKWRDFEGTLTFAGPSKWVIRNARYIVLLQTRAPGGVVRRDGFREAGWTVEVKWLAQGSADLSPADVYPLSRELAEGLGLCHESRFRRLDLAADVAGYELRPDDAERFVKRPRARLSEYAFADDIADRENRASAATEKVDPDALNPDEKIVRHWVNKITGYTVCPGGELMARIYDKRAHLQLLKEPTRDAELARWSAGGWDGVMPVTRVEFQMRGGVLAEFGIRNPERPHDPVTGEVVTLAESLDRIWRACIAWLSLRIENEEDEQRARWKIDPRWAVLEQAVFAVPTHETHRRLRVRGGATVEMTYGCALSIVAAVDALEEVRMQSAADEEDACADVHAHVSDLFQRVGVLAADHFLKKWNGGAEAWAHIATVQNATRLRLSDPLRPARALAAAAARTERIAADVDARRKTVRGTRAEPLPKAIELARRAEAIARDRAARRAAARVGLEWAVA